MSTSSSRPRQHLTRTAAAGLSVLAAGPRLAAVTLPSPVAADGAQHQLAAGEYAFAHENVLGTSLEMVMRTPTAGEAFACQQAVLNEIERLRLILSTYDPASEISRVRAGAPVESPELARVLAAYDRWSGAADGTISAHLADVIRLWREASVTGCLPDAADLQAAYRQTSALNVDALGKGFIVDRAAEVAQRYAAAGFVNIGGDIRAWGPDAWLIGVADPRQPAENAPLLATFPLRNAAVATSGGYARFMTMAGERWSHVVDPRTLRPASWLASATVVAADCLTANALSTAGCLLDAARTLALAAEQGSAGQLVVDPDGNQFRAGLLAEAPTPAAGGGATAAAPAAAKAWPKDFQVTVNVAIGTAAGPASGGPGSFGGPGGPGGPGGFGGRGGKRPYVAIWVENADHKVVRTLSVLGNSPRYLPELTTWWSAAGGNLSTVRTVTRATRGNGLYAVVWDGLDAGGKPAPRGTYTIRVEINREHGRHVSANAVLACGDKPVTAELAATAESSASKVEFGPKPAPAGTNAAL